MAYDNGGTGATRCVSYLALSYNTTLTACPSASSSLTSTPLTSLLSVGVCYPFPAATASASLVNASAAAVYEGSTTCAGTPAMYVSSAEVSVAPVCKVAKKGVVVGGLSACSGARRQGDARWGSWAKAVVVVVAAAAAVGAGTAGF